MIVRVLRAKVRAAKVGAFNALFRGQVALLKEQPGLVYVKLSRRLQPDGSEEAVLFEEWENAASLYAWVGPNLNEPRLVPGSRGAHRQDPRRPLRGARQGPRGAGRNPGVLLGRRCTGRG